MKTLNETNFSNDSRDAGRGKHGDGAGRDRVTQPFTITGCVANFQDGNGRERSRYQPGA
jgi:hypothetical protein